MECVNIEIWVYAISSLDFFSKEQHNYFVPFVLVSLLRFSSKGIFVETQLNGDFDFSWKRYDSHIKTFRKGLRELMKGSSYRVNILFPFKILVIIKSCIIANHLLESFDALDPLWVSFSGQKLKQQKRRMTIFQPKGKHFIIWLFYGVAVLRF